MGCQGAESSGMGTIKRKENIGVVTLDLIQDGIEKKIYRSVRVNK